MSAGTGWNVRVRPINARDARRDIEALLGHRIESIANNNAFRQELNQIYLDIDSQYVPYETGALRNSGHAVSEGRVIWSAWRDATKNSDPFNYAFTQYEDEYSHTYPEQDHWTDAVQPGTADWDELIYRARNLIMAADAWGGI